MKAGQKVWYIDQAYSKIKEGVLVNTENQSCPYERPTLLVNEGYKNHKLFSDRIFSTEKKCKETLEKEIRWNIKHMQNEIKLFKLKLKQLLE